MIQQKGTALTFYGFFTQDGVGDTGLTVTVDVYEATTATPIVSAGSATELAGGLYYYTLSSGSVDANAMYITIFKTTDTDTDQKQIPAAFSTPAFVDYIDASISTVDTVVDAIKAKTDGLNFTGTDVKATLDGEEVVTDAASRTASKADVSGLATAANLATVDTVVDAIKVTTDKVDDTLELDSTVYRFTTNALEQTPTGGSAPTAAAIADAVLDELIADHTGAGSLGKAVTDILADTNELQTNQHSAADVVSAMQVVAADFKADVSGLATAANLATVDTVADAIKATTDKIDDTLEDDAGTYRFTTNALEQAPTGGSAPTAAAIADAVWDEDLTGHGLTDSASWYIRNIEADTNTVLYNLIAGLNDISAADVVTAMQAVAADFKADVSGLATAANLATVDTVVDAIKVTTDKLDDTLELDSTVYRFTENALEQAPSGTGASAASIADAVLDELVADHTGAGSLGKAVSDILADTNELQGNQGNWLTATGFSTHSAADVVSAMLAEAASFKADVSALATAANLSVVDGIVDAIKLKTDNLPASPAATGDIPTTGDIVTAMQVVADDFKANVSGLSTFDPASDTVTLANGAHGGAAATLVLSDYSDFAGGAASIDYDEVASAVLDATATDYNTAGTIGNKINSAASAGDPWTADLTGYATDTAGAIIRRMGAALETTNAIITKSASVQELNIRRGDTLTAAFTGLGDITSYTDIWFTVKRDPSNADSAAEIQVTRDGLSRLNGVAATASNGSITVSDAAAGDVSVTVAAIETAKLAIRSGMYYDLQVKVGGVVSTIAAGRVNVIYDVTKSI